MKKIIVSAVVLLCAIVAVNAQPRAVGGRLAYGAEASYQHGFGDANMLEVDFGIPGFWGIEAAATYDWIFPITSWNNAGSWNWYAGVGGGAGWSWGGFANIGVAGRIGVEYNFWFPLQLSLDWRPVIGPAFYYGYAGYAGSGVGFNVDGLYAGAISLGIRYRF
jgi:hypothetical protein